MNQLKTFLDSKRADNKLRTFKYSFMKLKTDQERVKFTLQHYNDFSNYNNVIPSATGMPKNVEKSKKLHQQGIENFINFMKNKSEHMTIGIKSLKSYTKSIAFAPYKSKQLAFAYADRSEVLFELGLYSECIKDVDRALKLTYLEDQIEQKAQLYLRKAECLIILEKCLSVENLQQAEQLLNNICFKDVEKILNLYSKLNTLRLKAVQAEQSVRDNNLTRTNVRKSVNKPTITSYNAKVPCASDAVAIEYSEDYGRHLIATRDIKPGEVIAIEKPYTLLLSRRNMETHCSNCLKVCWANIPCKYCTYAMYCSKKCRNNDRKKYHNVECAVFPALIECGLENLDLLSLRVALLALREAENNMKKLETMTKEFDQCNDPRTRNFFQDGKLRSNKYIGVYNLLTYTEKRKFNDLFKMSWKTCIILYHLVTRTNDEIFDDDLYYKFRCMATNYDVTFFGGLILRHQQIISVNVHKLNEMQGLRTLERGVALLPFCSLINHSCAPNIFRQSRSKHIALHAIYPIKKGQQLFDSYGVNYIDHKPDVRKQKLKEYFLECDCVPCQTNLHDVLPLYNYLTQEAEGRIKIRETLKNLDTYYTLSGNDNIIDEPYIKKKLLKMIQMIHEYTTIPCKQATDVIIVLRRIYSFEGNRFKLPQIPTRQM